MNLVEVVNEFITSKKHRFNAIFHN